MLARPDQHPDRLLGARDFARLQAATVQRGLPASAARRLKPAVLALLLAEPACAIVPSGGKPYAEMLVANIAREHAIPVVGLESIAEQLDALDGLPPETERKLLIASMLLADRAEDVLETSVRRYSEGDTGGLLAWMRSREPLPGMPVAGIPPAFLDKLLDGRNRRMRDRILPCPDLAPLTGTRPARNARGGPMRKLLIKLCAMAAPIAAVAMPGPTAPAHAESDTLRIAKQYGLGYMQLIVMEERKLVEKHARAAGLGDVKVEWNTFRSSDVMNDALISGNLDFASLGLRA